MLRTILYVHILYVDGTGYLYHTVNKLSSTSSFSSSVKSMYFLSSQNLLEIISCLIVWTNSLSALIITSFGFISLALLSYINIDCHDSLYLFIIESTSLINSSILDHINELLEYHNLFSDIYFSIAISILLWADIDISVSNNHFNVLLNASCILPNCNLVIACCQAIDSEALIESENVTSGWKSNASLQAFLKKDVSVHSILYHETFLQFIVISTFCHLDLALA